MEQTASCRCGALAVTVTGEPLRVSICHCHNCQRRSGSAFAWQGRWPEEAASISGEHHSWSTTGESGTVAHFHFCPTCGGTVFYTVESLPGQIAVALGGMAGQQQPAPRVSVYENRLQPWLSIGGDNVEHMQ